MAQTPLYVGGVPAGIAKADILVRAWSSRGIALSLPVPGPVASRRACQVLAPLRSLPGLSLQVVSASSFDGCLRNPQLDGRPLGAPSRTFGVTPCYEGALESGVFFAADGGSIILGTPQQPALAPMALGLAGTRLQGGPLSFSPVAFLSQPMRS